jgi:predicted ATPase
LWRHWDLHIHAPETKLSDGYTCDGEVWDEYIDQLEKSPVQVFGITDYFSADGYFALVEKYNKKYPDTDKVFFPNVEFRLVEAISEDNSNPHIHVIFDNDPQHCPKESIDRFLSTLMTSAESPTGAQISCAELKTVQNFEAATVSIKELKDALDKTFGEEKPYLLAFPAKNDGVKSTDSKSPRKVLITDKIDKAAHCFFGDSSSRDYFLREDRYSSGISSPKPVVSGSDAHSFDELERLEGNVAGFEPTWIKADLTFRGLTQICFEPESRVHIGSEPDVEARKAIQATKFLSRLRVSSLEHYKDTNGSWFNNVDISLNPELIVIIGNKGSGKSALADIVGLLGDSRQQEYFSFLTNRGGNKKFKQRGYAENFAAQLEWESGAKVSKGLNDDIDQARPETVRYLPQNYFEQLTNDIEIEAFRREIEDVVFSHVDETDRMGKETFEELQEFKTQQSKQETSALKAQLRELNIEIVALEEQSDPATKGRLEGDLKARKDELLSLEKSKPVAAPKPDKQSEEQKALAAEIDSLTQKRALAEEKLKKLRELLTKEKSRLQRLSSLLESVMSLGAHVDAEKAELKAACDELGLDIDKIVLTTVNREPIDQQIEIVKAMITEIGTSTDIKFNTQTDFAALNIIPDLHAAKEYLQTKIDELKEKLGTPQRKYQNYLERLAKWEAKKTEVLGDQDSPGVGTIRNLEAKLQYIENELSQTLSNARNSRKTIVERIVDSKKKILIFYSELRQSVEAKLSAVRTDDFAVEIDASFVLDQSFGDDFLRFINKRKRGYFQGANASDSRLKNMLSEADWNDFNSVLAFIEGALQKLSSHDGQNIAIKDQIADVKDFYDYLFSLDYLSVKYELRLGGKNLNELSPGEKGLLLLIFYLQLDLDNIPLVIDQPEDNLDNDSIFAVLAKCIREAKKNRQVILVTHNPNLAVGADAEQIIYVKLEKAKNYKFSYETGSIENPHINQRIVDVLEGSQPAFVKRRLKYQIR